MAHGLQARRAATRANASTQLARYALLPQVTHRGAQAWLGGLSRQQAAVGVDLLRLWRRTRGCDRPFVRRRGGREAASPRPALCTQRRQPQPAGACALMPAGRPAVPQDLHLPGAGYSSDAALMDQLRRAAAALLALLLLPLLLSPLQLWSFFGRALHAWRLLFDPSRDPRLPGCMQAGL